MGFFESSLKIAGYPMDEAAAEYKKLADASPQDLASITQEKCHSILAYHHSSTEFYRNEVCKDLPQSWNDVPVMKKHLLQRPLNDRISTSYQKKKLYIGKTSGSSGTPTIFCRDKFTHAMIWNNILAQYRQHGIEYSQDYEARFYGINLSPIQYALNRVKDLVANRYRFVIFDLSEKQLDSFVRKFKKSPFKFMYGYTNSIVRFAKHLRDKDISIKELCPTLKLCIVTSEMLTVPDRKLLEDTLKVPIINEYGCSEVDIVAFQQPDGRWLLNNRTAFVEITDDEGNPVPDGKQGNITVTSLYNKAHPFIRYQVGDIGIISPETTNGERILSQLTGRTNDIAILPSGKEVPGYTFVYITKTITNQSGKVKEIRIIQNSRDHFTVNYSADSDLTAEEIKKIETAFFKYLEDGVKITINRIDHIPRASSGKLKQFTSELHD